MVSSTGLNHLISFYKKVQVHFGQNNVILYTLVSIITKVVLLVVIPLIIFFGLLAATSGEKDKRYKDGTKNNARTANIGLFSAIAAFLFMPLMKTKKDFY